MVNGLPVHTLASALSVTSGSSRYVTSVVLKASQLLRSTVNLYVPAMQYSMGPLLGSFSELLHAVPLHKGPSHFQC